MSQFDSIKGAFIRKFDEALKAAIVSEENINEDGSINWNFVDSDCFMELAKTFGNGGFDTDLYYDEFNAAADEEEEYRQAMA